MRGDFFYEQLFLGVFQPRFDSRKFVTNRALPSSTWMETQRQLTFSVRLLTDLNLISRGILLLSKFPSFKGESSPGEPVLLPLMEAYNTTGFV